MRSRGDKVSSSDAGSVGAVAPAWRRALRPGSEWPEKDELLDSLYWGRQGLAAVIGAAWALVPFYGALAIVLYVGVSSLIGHIYVTIYQRQDEDALGGFWEIAKEGFGSAFATFMITWIVTYSGLHAGSA